MEKNEYFEILYSLGKPSKVKALIIKVYYLLGLIPVFQYSCLALFFIQQCILKYFTPLAIVDIHYLLRKQNLKTHPIS